MRKRFLKLTVIAAFSAFAVCAFLISQKPAEAQEDNVLAAIADYKNWKETTRDKSTGIAIQVTSILVSG